MNEVNKLEMEFLASIVSDGFCVSFILFYSALFLRFCFLSVFGKDTGFCEVVPSFLASFLFSLSQPDFYKYWASIQFEGPQCKQLG